VLTFSVDSIPLMALGHHGCSLFARVLVELELIVVRKSMDKKYLISDYTASPFRLDGKSYCK
jgi:hypothetical protein